MGLLHIQENQNTRADGGPISIRRLCRRLDIDLKSTTCHEINIPFTSNVVLKLNWTVVKKTKLTVLKN